MTQRFTVDGGPVLEHCLEAWCADFTRDVRAIVPDRIAEAIALGGGYGRGEGGVLRTDGTEQAYNDLEFYVFVHGPLLVRERQFKRKLAELCHRWSKKAGIEFEAKLLTLDKLRKAAVSMMYHDLVVGHRWLFGDEDEFQNCDHHRAAHRIPLHEATRLLMNRASGLLFSKVLLEKLNFTEADADFVRRNISKAQLALGDVVLTAFGRYHASSRERHRRLEKLDLATAAPWVDELINHHSSGVEFKLHPFASTETAEHLRAEHANITKLTEQVFLWLEERRLGRTFASSREYALSDIRKHPDQRSIRNALINCRAFGITGFSTRYPRERLLESLALLLWTPDVFSESIALQKLQSNLMTSSADLKGLVEAYQTIWNRFN